MTRAQVDTEVSDRVAASRSPSEELASQLHMPCQVHGLKTTEQQRSTMGQAKGAGFDADISSDACGRSEGGARGVLACDC